MKTLKSILHKIPIAVFTMVLVSLSSVQLLHAQTIHSEAATEAGDTYLKVFTAASFNIPLFSMDAEVVSISEPVNFSKLPVDYSSLEQEERKRKRMWWIVGGATSLVVTSAILLSSSGGGSGDYIPEPPGRP